MLCTIFSYDYVADCRKSILNDIRKYHKIPIDFRSANHGSTDQPVRVYPIFSIFSCSWSGPFCEWSRIYFIELNTFFGKHYFRYPAKHWLCWGRMLFMGPVSAPAIKQYYSYATDTRCKRLGNHAWVS